MQVKPTDLAARLTGELSSVYFVSGDDTLLVEEACDAIVAAARKQGFGERSVLHIDSGLKWNDVLQDLLSMSLFAERRLLDLLDSENELFQSRTRLITADFVALFGKYRILADTGDLLSALDLETLEEARGGFRSGAGVKPDWQPGQGLTK